MTDEAIDKLRREADAATMSRDRFKTWVIGILLIICTALASSSCTVWIMQDDLLATQRDVTENRMKIESQFASTQEMKLILKDLVNGQNALNNGMARVEAKLEESNR